MKKEVLAVSALSALLLIAVASSKDKTKPSPISSILFIGDSNTAANYSYADQISKEFLNIKTKKVAKVGAKTDWMVTALKKELNLAKYDLVCVLGGSNDIYATGKIEGAKTNLNTMYSLIHEHGAKVMAISPPNKNFYIKKTPQKQILLSELILWIYKNPNRDYFINFWNLTNDKKYFSASDGYLHALKPAHQLLFNEVVKYIM